LVTTRDRFTSHVVVEEIGVISAGDVRSVNIFKDIAAAVLHMVSSKLLARYRYCNGQVELLPRTMLHAHGFVSCPRHLQVGGETSYYSHLLNSASEAAADKMVTHAKSLGANAIVGMRLETTTTMNRLVVGEYSRPLRAHDTD
jgi:uncharacterized protein YbjQ (UPF0145 family)